MKRFGVSLLVVMVVVGGTFVMAQEEVAKVPKREWIDWNKNKLMDPYENTKLPVEKRIENLLSRMTLEEKIPQMQVYAPPIEHLGVPAYNWRNECLHGAGVRKSGTHTVFPQAIGMAATWNPDLIYKVSTAISDEARAECNKAVAEVDYSQKYDIGVSDWGLTFWSPVVNIGRDPRWGRTQEGYGEDPYLVSRIGVAFVKGLQGEDPRYLKAVSTPKHFVANNDESRRHTGSATVPERLLREYYLAAFRACVVEGNAYGVMGAYNAVNGVPCCCNKTLLTDILREEWGFDGYVVADLGALEDIWKNHHYVSTAEEAAALALKAGIDLDDKGGSEGTYRQNLEKALEDGLISEGDIDRALGRLFTVRFRLGMFDPPEMVPYNKIPYEIVDCKEHRELALQTARESIVLLKNDNNLLPLAENKVKSIAVIGPYADVCQFGNYSGTPSKAITPLEGIENKVEGKIKITDMPELSDVAIVFVGLSKDIEGEGKDRKYLQLPFYQEDLIKEVSRVNENIIVVLIGGSSITMENWIEDVPAVLMAWYPGEEGGNAIADVLFGDYNPGGRLPLTFYKSIDQLLPFDDYDIRKGRTYLYMKEKSLFPFGYGLSYTKFDYKNLRVSPKKINAQDKIKISVDVKNVGKRGGGEVVQLYAHDVVASVERPIKELKRFKRINLKPGEKKKVTFILSGKELSYYDVKQKRSVVEPGIFDIMVGSSSEDMKLKGSFEVTEPVKYKPDWEGR